MVTVLLILHGVVAVFLVGAVTHQALSVWLPVTPSSTSTFAQAFRGVSAARYCPAVVVLYVAAMVLGMLVYPAFRVDVRAALFDTHYPWATGLFEVKEHWTAVGLGILPLYWSLWRKKHVDSQELFQRKFLTGLIAVIIWWNFVVGHVLNNLEGL